MSLFQTRPVTRSERIATIGAAVLLAIGTAYLLQRSLFQRSAELDFRFFWVAGKMWLEGLDPYGPTYGATGRQLFPTGNVTPFWVYPPNWWLFARGMASLPPEQGIVLWRLAQANFGLIGGLLIGLGVKLARPQTPWWFVLIAPTYVCFMQATPLSLAWGQASLLAFGGLAIATYALLTESIGAMVVALFILALKPHFAVILGVGLISRRRWWPAVAIGAVTAGLFALPHFLRFGLHQTLVNFAASMAGYANDPPNRVENLTGITQFMAVAGYHFYANITVPIAAVIGWAGSWRLAPAATVEARATQALLIVGTCGFFLPLHAYDAVCMAPLALLCWLFTGWRRWGLALASLILYRPGNIDGLFGPAPLLAGGRTMRELLIISVGLAIGFAVSAAIAFTYRARER